MTQTENAPSTAAMSPAAALEKMTADLDCARIYIGHVNGIMGNQTTTIRHLREEIARQAQQLRDKERSNEGLREHVEVLRDSVRRLTTAADRNTRHAERLAEVDSQTRTVERAAIARWNATLTARYAARKP